MILATNFLLWLQFLNYHFVIVMKLPTLKMLRCWKGFISSQISGQLPVKLPKVEGLYDSVGLKD